MRVFYASENSQQLYVPLFFLPLASTKKRPHTLHCSFPFIACVSIQTYANYSLNTIALINGQKKKKGGYICVLCTCSPICDDDYINCLPISSGWFQHRRTTSNNSYLMHCFVYSYGRVFERPIIFSLYRKTCKICGSQNKCLTRCS